MTLARRSRKRLAKTRRTPGRYVAELFFKFVGVLYFICYRANNTIDVSRYERISPKVPAAFDGFRVVQVSDLHGKVFGRDNAKLLKLVEREKPDLIVVTGDVVDERNFRLDSLRDFAERLVKIAPVFYIVGNHEADLYAKYFYEVVATLRKSGFTLLLDREKRVTRGNGDAIVVAGLMDVKESRKFANIARPPISAPAWWASTARGGRPSTASTAGSGRCIPGFGRASVRSAAIYWPPTDTSGSTFSR